VPIDDPWGGSVGPGVSALVVSADTLEGGRAVNVERRRRGLSAVPVVVVPLALADDLLPVSSRRIRAGAIDRRGHRVSPIRVGVTTHHPEDARVATRIIGSIFPGARLVVRAASRRAGPRAPASRADELRVRITRTPRGGWTVRERSPEVELPPVHILGTRPSELARGLRSVLRPTGRSGPR
jgi:hypothetical protein